MAARRKRGGRTAQYRNRQAEHLKGLLAYLSSPSERANEDLALAFFRKEFKETFTRQSDAMRADGYVPGLFVLELKAKTSDWFAGLMQGLAYNRTLDFSQVVVCAKEFLGVWSIRDLPPELVAHARTSKGASSTVGRTLARTYARRKQEVLQTSQWLLRSELLADLFADSAATAREIQHFLKVVRTGKKSRLKVTTRNFTSVLKQLKCFFPPDQPLMAVRAFYSLVFGWSGSSKVEISHRAADQVTVSGESISSVVPGKRVEFADFIEQRKIHLQKHEHIDDFFAQYDRALDAVDPGFRKENGIFFTDLNLSRLAMWFVKRVLGDIGRDYLVIDPACGSGNLVMNWRSPLELRHKVVSEIEPELLFAVERRMKSDFWHDGKFSVVPRVAENRGLNFLEVDAATYLGTVQRYLAEKGQNADKPIAVLCNPPYRNDDDQSADSIAYPVHDSILRLTGKDASAERYCCFLAQMKNICCAAQSSGVPGESLLLLFTKSAWLTKRPIFAQIRSEILGDFENIGGFLINGREFFDVKGKFPVAFTVWRHVGGRKLDPSRSVPLHDLTWVKKAELISLPWEDEVALDKECLKLMSDTRAITVRIGAERRYIDSDWCLAKIKEFQRDRRKLERGEQDAGGLPKKDRRRRLKKTYGESNGTGIGFMDDLTPCRIRAYKVGPPWFRLNKPFMDCRKTRCFSGPPDQKGYSAEDERIAKRLFLWFSISRAFEACSYPMWCDADKLWVPDVPRQLRDEVKRISYSIVYADNECIDAAFPANNPVSGAAELYIANPLTPLDPESYWSVSYQQAFAKKRTTPADNLVEAVDALYALWNDHFRHAPELHVGYKRPYFVGPGVLTRRSGIRQIVDYGNETGNEALQSAWREIQHLLKATQQRLHMLLVDGTSIGYFGSVSPADRVSPILPALAGRPRRGARQLSERTPTDIQRKTSLSRTR